VRNITDVDDKINARASAEGIPIRELTERTFQQYQADVTALGCLPPTVQPRATEHIAEMIEIIQKLIANGHAYAADGHVLFDVPSMQNYGQLSRRSLDEMVAGARVDVAPYKRGDMDFVLWKPSGEGTPGWDSPWGRGRPGWHIECSAMSWKHLGETFDIHGGGIDLIFPHHENEVAQNLCAFGHKVMANCWMHNGFLQVEGQKMSKSLGNFVTIHEFLETDKFGGRAWPGEVLRFAMLRTHYRQPIDWTHKGLDEAETTLERLYDRAQGHLDGPMDSSVLDALSDDLNTPLAMSRIFSLADPAVIAGSLGLLGFSLRHEQLKMPLPGIAVVNEDQIDRLIAARLDARKAKNWAESDHIRDELARMGIAIKDNKDGTTSWEVKR
ncbi:MAG: cysteine--tRNA ligase, partial [Alphaproteobacteria bacterium]|nr:cysteine--tRNA ligase [Alphaproteobacteria bacterium]